ncbi:hypothetical protein [Rhodanobacter sp. C05]|uniref:hypothetical protein n=1 Tax=Rhodanobacter sp. C05 TaxID=1945855 RepID=UPI00117BCF5C|nr:hypothetical protein [Rhodanobacter sp. C05]
MTDWNKPDSKETLKLWLLIDPLTLFQVVMLIFGRDPSHDITGRPRGYVPIMAALKQAIERREVPALQTRDTTNGDFFSLHHEDLAFVTQADVRQWLRTIDHTDAFFFLADPNHWPDVNKTASVVIDKPLATHERSNMLRIIRALDVMAKLPDRGPTSSVMKQLQELGFARPSDDTIRRVITEARALEKD